MGISATILLLSATAAFAAPLIFAAIGELISEKAGVINIELEAMMLAGAFCGVWAALASGSLGVGFIGAALGGVMVAFAHGLLCFVFRAEQVVSGVVLNIFVLGLTTFGIGPIFGSNLWSRSANPVATGVSILVEHANRWPPVVLVHGHSIRRVPSRSRRLVGYKPHKNWLGFAGGRRST